LDDESSEELSSIADFDASSATGSDFLSLYANEGCGESGGSIDVKKMRMVFSRSTGEYVIVLKACREEPFVGWFRVCVNLFNPGLGTAHDPAFFNRCMDYNYSGPEEVLVLTGDNDRLTAWEQGQLVYTNSMRGGPNPDFVTQFRTAVSDLPLVGIGGEWIGHKDLTTPIKIQGAGSFPK